VILPGHVAAAYLAASALGADRRAVLAASLFPDLVDKPVRWLLRLTPNDRIPAHTLLVCMLTWVAARLLLGQSFSRGWLVGYSAHLLCDQVNAHLNPGRLYLWWPFRRYKMHTGPTGLGSSLNDFSPASLLLEGSVVVLGVAAWLVRRGRR